MFKRLTTITLVLLVSACATENSIDNTSNVTKNAEPSNADETVQITQNSSANKNYDEAVKAFKSAPTLLKVKQLKLDYISTDYYQPFSGSEQKLSEQMFSYVEAKDWSDCLIVAEQILASNYVSFNGHYGAMACSFESDKKSAGLHHREVLSYLLDAMWQSGDGRGPNSALVSLSTTEIYGFLKLTGFQVLKQSMFEFKKLSYELVRVIDPDSNEEFDLFFNNSIQWQYGFKHVD
ncbi:DUF4919 domain-containing protein [Colwelliaceae bacterium BS250]